LAIEDAIKFDAFSSEYITNILEQLMLHHTEAVVIEGDSYRMREEKSNYNLTRLAVQKQRSVSCFLHTYLKPGFYDIFTPPLTD
jgi:hypothetical protein